jgi:hypothetical protein
VPFKSLPGGNPKYSKRMNCNYTFGRTAEFTAAAMAVDPRGGVYVTPFVTDAQPLNPFVEKLSADGAGVAWKTPIGFRNSLRDISIPLAVDSTGRAFAAVVDQQALLASFE